MMKKTGQFLIYYALLPFAAGLPFFVISMFNNAAWVDILGVPAIMLVLYAVFRKQLDFAAGERINGGILLALTVIFTVMMVIAGGSVEGAILQYFCLAILPFAPIMLLPLLMGDTMVIYATAFVTYLAGWLFCTVKTRQFKVRKLLVPLLGILVCLGLCGYLYANRPAARYGGHGFPYMNGYSGTDFTDYTVYAKNSKLVTLDHEASLVIEDVEEMPVLDGAEACYPLYAGFAKAAYKDIDKIELAALDTDYKRYNGRVVTFTNTVFGLERLFLEEDLEKKGNRIDMFFGARPSADQIQMARAFGTELTITPIGKEAFVFFVEEDNPVSDISSEDLKRIYSGEITDWSYLGGKKQEIAAFQRPRGSGSQTVMEYFMGDVPLKEPKTYEVVSAMDGVIRRVADYANEEGAIGYTFRYFLEELNEERGVKILSVDGITPDLESIEDGSYPLTVDLCLVTRKDEENPNVEKMLQFILSEDGRQIMRRTGYAPLKAAVTE